MTKLQPTNASNAAALTIDITASEEYTGMVYVVTEFFSWHDKKKWKLLHSKTLTACSKTLTACANKTLTACAKTMTAWSKSLTAYAKTFTAYAKTLTASRCID